MRKIFAVVLGLLLVVGFGAPAVAGGSDSPTPYTVTVDGITLPEGVTFVDGGHVNIKGDFSDRGIHFESLNWTEDNPKRFYIGKSFIPWSAFGLDPATVCVTWVQLSQYNEHYGEGNQPPVGRGCEEVPDKEDPPVTTPPPTSPPVTEPPVTEPPTTEPPTSPPVTEPPASEPPTSPPVTTPPVEPPTTSPPVTSPPVTSPPPTTPPIADTGVEDVVPYLLVGGVLLLAGVGSVLYGRRMRANG